MVRMILMAVFFVACGGDEQGPPPCTEGQTPACVECWQAAQEAASEECRATCKVVPGVEERVMCISDCTNAHAREECFHGR